MADNDLMKALNAVEKTEANLTKAERVWSELQHLFPSGLTSGDNPEYEDRARSFEGLLLGLPPIEGWRPVIYPPDMDAVFQTRLDLLELAEPLEEARFEAALWAEGSQLRDYRFRLNRLRRKLMRDKLVETMAAIEIQIAALHDESGDIEHYDRIHSERWQARMREQRLALGLSQVTLGVRLGVTFQQIQKYERGANRVSAAKLYQAARALDVEMAFFFVGLPETSDGPAARLTPPNGAEGMPTPEDLSLLRDFHRLSSNSQRAVLDVIKELAGRGAPDGDDG